MHKNFYASGFLYHPSSEQILLQQNSTTSTELSSWLLFEACHGEKEQPAELFKNIIFALLDIKIDLIHPVYSYYNVSKNGSQSIVYSTVRKLHEFSSKNGIVFSWFSFKDVLKLQITEQTKHDIVVGQRVIDAALRKSRGEHTFQ